MKTFPILLDYRECQTDPPAPRLVPWSLLAPHEEQALRNHGQTLEQLADRGGLHPTEMLAIIEHRRWRAMPLDEALAGLARAVAEMGEVAS